MNNRRIKIQVKSNPTKILTAELSPWRPSREWSRSWFRLSLISCSCFSSSIKWSILRDFPLSFGLSSSFYKVHANKKSLIALIIRLNNSVEYDIEIHRMVSLSIFTFFSDSFPLAAKGGGMKDGTYLQKWYDNKLPYIKTTWLTSFRPCSNKASM